MTQAPITRGMIRRVLQVTSEVTSLNLDEIMIHRVCDCLTGPPTKPLLSDEEIASRLTNADTVRFVLDIASDSFRALKYLDHDQTLKIISALGKP